MAYEDRVWYTHPLFVKGFVACNASYQPAYWRNWLYLIMKNEMEMNMEMMFDDVNLRYMQMNMPWLSKNVQPQSEIAKTVAFSMERLSLRSIYLTYLLPTYPSIHAITAATNCSSLKSFGWWSPLIQWPLEMHTDSAGVHASSVSFMGTHRKEEEDTFTLYPSNWLTNVIMYQPTCEWVSAYTIQQEEEENKLKTLKLEQEEHHLDRNCTRSS